MHGRLLSLTGAAGLLLSSLVLSTAGISAQEPGLKAYRFVRPGNQTLVEAFAAVPFGVLTFTPVAGKEKAVYEGTLEVRDSSGLVLTKQSWRDSVVTAPVTAETRERAFVTQRFAFSLAPGRYTLSLSIKDDASGRVTKRELPVTSLQKDASTSDLIVAATLGAKVEGRALPPGAVVRGKLVAMPNLEGSVPTSEPKIAVMAEIYRSTTAAESASVTATIRGANGDAVFRTPALHRVFRGGGVDAIAVDLSGLTPGDYSLTAEWVIGRDTLRASHPLRVLLPSAGEVVFTAEAPYRGLTEAQLDSIYRPMKYIMDADDEVSYEVLRDADSKRRFLAKFWLDRARAMEGSADDMRKSWDEAVSFVNLRFRPPRIGKKKRMGWESDRGRIYLTYGPPAERMDDRNPDIGRNPWEAWRYLGGRGDKYLFWDRTGMGEYELIFSTNPAEPAVPYDQASARRVIEFVARW